jgi:hypothetical protein
MRRGAGVAIQLLTLLSLSVSPWWLFAQTPKPPSLDEQLRAQYKVVTMVASEGALTVTDPGTVLAIRKEGILAVNPRSSVTCASKYQDGNLKTAGGLCGAVVKQYSRLLTVGEKVYPLKIEVNVSKGRITFGLIECDACNGVTALSSYKALVEFQFAKGALESMSATQVEDVVAQVLAIDESSNQQEQQAQEQGQAEQQGQVGEAPGEVITNGDVVKMVKAKLGDSIIISKIKSSACNFDTSVDALVKLKEAGVSDAVIQAMHDAQEAARAGNEQALAPNSVAGHYVNAVSAVEYMDLKTDGSFFLHPSNDKNWAGAYTISGDAVVFRVADKTAYRMTLNGDHLVDQQGNQWTRQGDPPPTVQGQLSFSVRHRHSLWETSDNVPHFCYGTLTVSSDGTVAYDCVRTDDPSGRCEHVSFPRGSLKEVKIGDRGSLRLVTRRGNLDFLGSSDDIKQAQASIAQLAQTTQK